MITISFPFSGTSILDWQIYSAASTGLFIVIVIAYISYKCGVRQKQRSGKIHQSVSVSNDLINNTERAPGIDLQVMHAANEEIYHYIDEDQIEESVLTNNQIIEPSLTNNPYLEVIDSSSSSISTYSVKDNTSYLQPYNELVTTADTHTYEDRRREIKYIDSKISNDKPMRKWRILKI